MPRPLKPLKVGEHVERGLGVTVTLYYDRDRHTHFAEYGGERYEDLQIAEVKKKLAGAIKAAQEVAWFAVVEVRSKGDHHYGRGTEAQAGLAYERHWIARLPNGKLRGLYWSPDPFDDGKVPSFEDLARTNEFYIANGGQAGEFVLPYQQWSRSPRDGQRAYLAYTPELWAGLKVVEAELARIRARIDALVNVAGGGPGALAAAGVRFLAGETPLLLGAGGGDGAEG